MALHCQKPGMEFDASGDPASINRDAFRVDDDGISINWIEFDGGDLAATCLLLATVRKVRKNHRVAVINVGSAEKLGNEANKTIAAIHDPIEQPEKPNPGHALLTGVGDNDNDLLDALTVLADINPFSAESIALSKSTFGR